MVWTSFIFTIPNTPFSITGRTFRTTNLPYTSSTFCTTTIAQISGPPKKPGRARISEIRNLIFKRPAISLTAYFVSAPLYFQGRFFCSGFIFVPGPLFFALVPFSFSDCLFCIRSILITGTLIRCTYQGHPSTLKSESNLMQ